MTSDTSTTRDGRTSAAGRLRRVLAAAGIVLAAGLAPAGAQYLDPDKEGFDPLRQITTQFLNPNVLISMDVSGSMAYNIGSSSNVGVDNQGPGWRRAWVRTRQNTSGCSSSTARTWRYELTLHKGPSRMVIVKNALGDSVWLSDPAWLPPARWPRVTAGGFNLTTEASLVDDTTALWRFRWEYASNSGNCAARPFDQPFSLDHEVFPRLTVPPQNLVGRTAGLVNWGLLTWTSNNASPVVLNITRVRDVNPDDDGQTGAVSTILAALRLVSDGGLPALDFTPTNAALNASKASLAATAEEDTKAICGRLNAVILVTDGESNACNSGSITCATGGTATRVDAGRAPRRADELFLGGSDGSSGCRSNAVAPVGTQTFVIGVSDQVSRCELNLIGYYGRTDASAVNPASWQGNARLPQNTTGTTSFATFNQGTDAAQANYAYFANTVEALNDAFEAIVTSLGVGDYATGPPTVASGSTAVELYGYVTSARYPEWKGHLYAYDLVIGQTKACSSANPAAECTAPCGTTGAYCAWDAGEVLSSGNNGHTRKILTWRKQGQSWVTEEVTASSTSATTLKAICGTPCAGVSDAEMARVADFIVGNDGFGNARSWQLGAIINSTPAVAGPPEEWRQARLASHDAFKAAYQGRHTMVWFGASDGMVHAVDRLDGAVVLSLLPPTQIENQVRLYRQFRERPTERVTGQKRAPYDHLYGVANSPRFAEVYFPQPREYKTVLFVSEGPGGTGLHAIDITHPYPGRTVGGEEYSADPNYDSSAPVEVLWSLSADGRAGTTALAGLARTWSVPALMASGGTTWELLVGSGENPNADGSTQPRSFRLSPVDGSVRSTATLPVTHSDARVRNQAFADSVLWEREAAGFKWDNILSEGLQADLNGRVFAMTPAGSWSASALFDVGRGNPIYYNPAVESWFPMPLPTYNLYAFATGSFYEQSSSIASDIHDFDPTLHLKVRTRASGDISCSVEKVIKEIQIGDGDDAYTLGARSQVTGRPMIISGPAFANKQQPFALFPVYDPEATQCIGRTYLLTLGVNPSDCTSFVDVAAGQLGAAGGFAIAGSRIIFSRSNVGETGRATIDFYDYQFPLGDIGAEILWWRELR